MVAILNSLFRQHHGYLVTEDPDPTKSKGQVAKVEVTTITCGHRGELVCVPAGCKPEDMPFELCWGCRRHICQRCAARMKHSEKCIVIEQRLEHAERGNALMRAIGR
jgi:hypothetical protein